MRSRVESRRGSGRLWLPDAARRAAKVTILLAAVLLAAVTAAPTSAQTSGGDPPDYVLKEDGTVVIDGDGATDCRSFASFLEQGDFEPPAGNPSQQAQSVLEQCEEAGLLDSGGGTPSASAGVPSGASPSPEASAVDGEGGELPETGGPALPVSLVVSVVVVAGGLLARKVVG